VSAACKAGYLKNVVEGVSLVLNISDLKQGKKPYETHYQVEVYLKDMNVADYVKKMLPLDVHNCLIVTTLPTAVDCTKSVDSGSCQDKHKLFHLNIKCGLNE
jgi:hypothetical protein